MHTLSFMSHTCTDANRKLESKKQAKKKKPGKTKSANKKSKVSKKKTKDFIDHSDDDVINIQFIP